MAQDGVVRAAGGVVSRRGEGGEVEVLLVHRPEHGDWSFSKSKVEAGEMDEECALREVWEEAGIPAAANLLSYPGDRELLAAFAER